MPQMKPILWLIFCFLMTSMIFIYSSYLSFIKIFQVYHKIPQKKNSNKFIFFV